MIQKGFAHFVVEKIKVFELKKEVCPVRLCAPVGP